MQSINQYPLFLFILAALVCCQTRPESISTTATTTYRYDYSLVEQRTKRIQVDSTTRNRLGEYRARLWETSGSQTKLLALNPGTNQVQFYDWASGELEKTIQLQAEGPHAVGKPRGFWVLDDSTLVVPHQHSNAIMLTDHQGKIKRKYPQKYQTKRNPDPGATGFSYSAEPMPMDHQPMFCIGSKLYFCVYPDLDRSFSSFFEHGKVALVLDTVNGQSDYSTSYPPPYHEKGKFSASPYQDVSWTFDPVRGKVTFSFPADVNLYVTNTSLAPGMAHEVQSRLAPGPVKFKDKPEQDERKFYLANHHYKALFFDPYRRVYYRFVHLPARPLMVATETGSEMTDGVPVSVIVLDDQHQVIGETELPYPLGMVGGAWIDREGLWIEGANPANYLKLTGRNYAAEDEIAITLFTLHENKK
jgi:hypothetical protein